MSGSNGTAMTSWCTAASNARPYAGRDRCCLAQVGLELHPDKTRMVTARTWIEWVRIAHRVKVPGV
jgi:hypothetical protein